MSFDPVQIVRDQARYEIIDDPEPFYGELVTLPEAWATGITPEACRQNLEAAVADWLLFSLSNGVPLHEEEPSGESCETGG